MYQIEERENTWRDVFVEAGNDHTATIAMGIYRNPINLKLTKGVIIVLSDG